MYLSTLANAHTQKLNSCKNHCVRLLARAACHLALFVFSSLLWGTAEWLLLPLFCLCAQTTPRNCKCGLPWFWMSSLCNDSANFSVALQFCYFCWSVLFTFWDLLSPCLTPECGDYRHSLLCLAHFSFTKYRTKLSISSQGSSLMHLHRPAPPPFFYSTVFFVYQRLNNKTRAPAWVKASTDQFCYMAVFGGPNVKVLSVNVMKFWCSIKDMFKTRFLCRHLQAVLLQDLSKELGKN